MPACHSDAGKKNNVFIQGNKVVKTFTQGAGKRRRFYQELQALRRLSSLEGIPQLHSYSSTERRITLAYIPGKPLSELESVPDELFRKLHIISEDMLSCGVARHALPARDVLVCFDGSTVVVDFERCTLRRCRFGPIWWLSCTVARFNLLRLIDAYAPHLLSQDDRSRLQAQYKLRARFHHYKDGIRRCLRRWKV